MLPAFFILSRIVANPLSNVFQKRLGAFADPRLIILATHLLLSLVCLPVLLILAPRGLGIAFWENMGLCALLAVAGNTLIVAALKSADLSVLGPLNAYKSVVGLVLGAILLGELPNLPGLLGVAMILGGSFLVLDGGARSSRGRSLAAALTNRGVRLRFAALVLSAAEAVFLKKALLASSPLVTFLFWCVLGLPLAAIVVIAAFGRNTGREAACLRLDPAACILLALTTGLMQFSTLQTFGVLQVGTSLALFQISTLLSVLFGYRFFHEQHLARRLLGAAVMITGAILIAALPRTG